MPISSSQPRLQKAYWPLTRLPGLSTNQGDGLLQQLQTLGITTTEHLLRQTQTSASQQELAIALKLSPQRLRKWVALADLAQIPAIGPRYCGLILHAGVSSCGQLAQMPAARLHQQILRLQVAVLRRKDQCPTVAEVTQWVQQARQLCRPSR